MDLGIGEQSPCKRHDHPENACCGFGCSLCRAKRKERKMPMEVKRYFCQGKEITLEEAKKIDEENKALIASPLLVDWEKIKVVTVLKEKEGAKCPN